MSRRAAAFRCLSFLCASIGLATVLSAAGAGSRDDNGNGKNPTIQTVSTRPDRVSGGDVLVEIAVHNGSKPAVRLNGRDISGEFQPGRDRHSLLGLVKGLELGKNKIAAGNDMLQVTNYPISGPISSGPHIKPFICDTHRFKLPDDTSFTDQEIANDPTCSAPTKITYLYMPTGGKAFVPLPSTSLPADVATTTTTDGVTVKYIVRVETSTINRGIYQSAILHDPTVDPPPTPFAPPKGWNRRLISVQGFGCTGGWYRQGERIGTITTDGMPYLLLQINRLGEGYALFSNTLHHPTNNCNSVLAGEAAMMSKEHFIETYGEPRYTVSAGASGGSYGSFQLADQFPGLYDGVLFSRTFTDPLSVALSGFEARLILNYLATNQTGLTPQQISAISGYKMSGPDGLKAMVDAAAQSGRADPVAGRTNPGIARYSSGAQPPALSAAMRYDPKTNPRGARGDVFDAARNIYGIDPKTGFAFRPFDNVGVQYGLEALNSSAITPKQFLDLNEGIGGLDLEANNIPARSAADAGALKRAYQSGLQMVGNGGLASIPIVNMTGLYDEDAGYHYLWFHFGVRERLKKANGNLDNHVSWLGKTDMVPFEPSWGMFINWMEAIEKDSKGGTAREKTIRNRPSSVVDGCWTSPTQFIPEPATLSSKPDTPCHQVVPGWTFPRAVAGGPIAADILKCELKRVDRKDYNAALGDEDFTRLKRIFPEGVCDWSKKGVGQTGVVPWASFGPAPENLVFDINTAR